MKISSIEITNETGLHARAASKLAEMASKYSATIKVGHSKMVDGKSILALMMLAATQGTILKIEIKGTDEEKAMESILKLISTGFGEGA
ncbi:MAG: HPr family phosphocarrier protein [Gammaproteobacteria bacterium]|nr:HPr family phosphocarrier protein [Gammaproteobacteria bacterium]